MTEIIRTPTKKKAKEIAKILYEERPDYQYIKRLFKDLRTEMDIVIPKELKKLPYVPTEEEISRYYQVVWNSKNFQDMLIIKTFLYTGVRVSELVNIEINKVNLEACQITIIQGKGSKDRVVPFPPTFKEVLALHIDAMHKKNARYLFESNRKYKYTDRAIRKMLTKYSETAKLEKPLFPHALRHFLFTWLKKKGIDDALIQPYSGHENRQSLEIYSKLSITEAQNDYNEVISQFPI